MQTAATRRTSPPGSSALTIRSGGRHRLLSSMKITSLSVRGFRNISEIHLEPGDRLTVVMGDNGQGKTNLIEALFYVATLKALRAARLDELVEWGADLCEIEASVFETVSRELCARVQFGRRTSQIDGKAVSSIEVYSKALKVVAFTPDDLRIVKGAASERRRWIDRVAFTRNLAYLSEHRRFERALRSRNKLLKEARERGRRPAELEAFDEAVVVAGARVLRRRIEVLRELGELAPVRFENIMKSSSRLELSYSGEAVGPRPGMDEAGANEDTLAENLRRTLATRRESDVSRGFTTTGPQSDDVRLCLDGKDMRTFASQGQQRAAVLALKIAEIENLRATLGRTPVLLLDDVTSELDSRRNAHLLEYLSCFPGQAFVTTTDSSLVTDGGDIGRRRVRIEAGRVLDV